MPYCINCGKQIEEGCKCEDCLKKEQDDLSEVMVDSRTYKKPKDSSKLRMVLNILTAIIYPLVAVVLNFLFGGEKFFLLGIGLALIACGLIIVSGVYVIVIPLYFVNFYKFGSANRNMNRALKITLGILAVVCLVASFVFAFI